MHEDIKQRKMVDLLKSCTLCPRKCGVDRTAGAVGFCGASDQMEVSKIMLHQWEEPCISGSDKLRGSGAVFFTHCPLGCIYCQNRDISGKSARGTVYTEAALAEEFLQLQKMGAYNINLVSPTHYTPQLIRTVALAREKGLTIPIVWNTGGYERRETVALLEGTVDIFLTDAKYFSPDIAAEFSHAPDYWNNCLPSLLAMTHIAGKAEYDENGMMKRGVILRHLVLPGCRNDSVEVLGRIAEMIPPENVVLSLMSQYTPEFFTLPENPSPMLKKLGRRITSFEYNFVADEAMRLGFDGYMQERTSATSRFTPKF